MALGPFDGFLARRPPRGNLKGAPNGGNRRAPWRQRYDLEKK